MSDDLERQLRIELMRADITNKTADTAYKTKLTEWEPWKAMAVAAGAGAGLMGVVIGLLTLILRHG